MIRITGRSFVLSAAQTSPSSLISDVIRKIDHEVARFSRFLGTFSMHVDTTGLKLADSDMLVVLFRSLPEAVKNYIFHHTSADRYEAYRNLAMRWEEQHRLFNDFEVNGKKVNSLAPESGTGRNGEHYSLENEWNVDTMTGDRCIKCGSRRHDTGFCTVDVNKLKYFCCGKTGHVSFFCPTRPENGQGKGGWR